jgi:hypothetical protein
MDCLALSNCEVKEAKYFTGLQVIVKKSTEGHDFSKEVSDGTFFVVMISVDN